MIIVIIFKSIIFSCIISFGIIYGIIGLITLDEKINNFIKEKE